MLIQNSVVKCSLERTSTRINHYLRCALTGIVLQHHATLAKPYIHNRQILDGHLWRSSSRRCFQTNHEHHHQAFARIKRRFWWVTHPSQALNRTAAPYARSIRSASDSSRCLCRPRPRYACYAAPRWSTGWPTRPTASLSAPTARWRADRCWKPSPMSPPSSSPSSSRCTAASASSARSSRSRSTGITPARPTANTSTLSMSRCAMQQGLSTASWFRLRGHRPGAGAPATGAARRSKRGPIGGPRRDEHAANHRPSGSPNRWLTAAWWMSSRRMGRCAVSPGHTPNSAAQAAFDPRRRLASYAAAPGHPIGQALASGASNLLPDLSQAWAGHGAEDSDHIQLLRDLACRGAMIIPVIAPGQPIGVMTFGLVDPHRKYLASDRELAEELADRVALALAHTRLYAAEQRARVEAEQRLAMLTAVINSIPDALYIGDASGITICNDAALPMLGFATREELNQDIAVLAERAADPRSSHRANYPARAAAVCAGVWRPAADSRSAHSPSFRPARSASCAGCRSLIRHQDADPGRRRRQHRYY